MEINNYFLTISQTANLLNTTRQTISRWIQDGKFSSQRMGRMILIPKQDVRHMLEKRIQKDEEHLKHTRNMMAKL